MSTTSKAAGPPPSDAIEVVEVTKFSRLTTTTKIPETREWFDGQTLIALVNNRFLNNKSERDEDTMVLATRWSSYSHQLVEIMEPVITPNKHYLTLRHLGNLPIVQLKMIPPRPSNPDDHHVEGSWLRYIGREYAGLAKTLKHDMVIYGRALPICALERIRDHEESQRKAQT